MNMQDAVEALVAQPIPAVGRIIIIVAVTASHPAPLVHKPKRAAVSLTPLWREHHQALCGAVLTRKRPDTGEETTEPQTDPTNIVCCNWAFN